MKVYAHKKNGDYIEFTLTGKGKSGGEGTMYEIGQIKGLTGNYCAKIYKDKYLEKHGSEKYNKLVYMIQHPPKKLHDDTGNIRVCYPKFVLFDSPYRGQGKFVGFVMPLAPKESMDLIKLTRTESANFKPYRRNVSNEDRVYYEFPRPNSPNEVAKLENRYRIIHNIASVFSWLHSEGSYVVGDIKRENLLMTIGRGVFLVDVDSVQITNEKGNVIFRNEVCTPEYCPPEFLQKKMNGFPIDKKSVSYDLFSMAVLFYWILIGTHPYNCSLKGNGGNAGVATMIVQGCFAYGKKKGQLELNKNHIVFFPLLPKSIQNLFIRAFEGKPEQRPTALEWKHAIRSIITSIPRQPLITPQPIYTQPKATIPTTTPNPINQPPSNPLSTTMPTLPSKCACGTQYYKSYSRYCHRCGRPR